MPRTTIYPADSASQVSTNRGSQLGRQQGQHGNPTGNVSGSMLGRASAGNPPYRSTETPSSSRRAVLGSALGRQSDVNGHRQNAQYNSANLGPRTLLGRQSGQQRGQGRTLSTIQEGSAVRTSLSARGMDQLNQSFGAMNVNVGVSNNQRGAPRSLVRQSQSVVEAPQPVQSTSQTAPAEDPKRFIPLTRQNIHDRLGNLLCRLFQVQPAKVHGWLREGLIRVDTQKYKDGVFPYDIEPLTQQLTQKDIEKWDSWVQGYDSDRALKKAIGPGQGAYVDFERDFQGSRSSRAPRPTRSSSGRYDPRCPGCRFRGGYCGGVDAYHIIVSYDPRW